MVVRVGEKNSSSQASVIYAFPSFVTPSSLGTLQYPAKAAQQRWSREKPANSGSLTPQSTLTVWNDTTGIYKQRFFTKSYNLQK